MSPRSTRPFWSTALRLHVPLVVGVAVCLYAGWFELNRARTGHPLAWVYAVEWPMFAVAGVVIWWRIVTDRDTPSQGPRTGPHSRDIADDDPGLQAWRRYQAETRQQERQEPDEVG